MIHFRKIASKDNIVFTDGRDGHEALYGQARKGCDLRQEVRHRLVGHAAFRLLFPDIDFEEDLRHEVVFHGLFGDLLRHFEAVHGLDGGDFADDLPDLVGLQMADEVAVDAVEVELRFLAEELLHAVLTDEVDAAVERVVDEVRFHCFGDRHQVHVFRVPAVLDSRLRDVVADLFDVLFDVVAPGFPVLSQGSFRHISLCLPG